GRTEKTRRGRHQRCRGKRPVARPRARPKRGRFYRSCAIRRSLLVVESLGRFAAFPERGSDRIGAWDALQAPPGAGGCTELRKPPIAAIIPGFSTGFAHGQAAKDAANADPRPVLGRAGPAAAWPRRAPLC